MSTATLSDFRQNQAHYIAAAQVEPVELRSRGAQTRDSPGLSRFLRRGNRCPRSTAGSREREEYETWLRENALPALEHYLEHPETAHTLDELTAAWGLK